MVSFLSLPEEEIGPKCDAILEYPPPQSIDCTDTYNMYTHTHTHMVFEDVLTYVCTQ